MTEFIVNDITEIRPRNIQTFRYLRDSSLSGAAAPAHKPSKTVMRRGPRRSERIFITWSNGFPTIYAEHFSLGLSPTLGSSECIPSTQSYLLHYPTHTGRSGRSAGLYSLCWRALESKVFHLPPPFPTSWNLLS